MVLSALGASASAHLIRHVLVPVGGQYIFHGVLWAQRPGFCRWRLFSVLAPLDRCLSTHRVPAFEITPTLRLNISYGCLVNGLGFLLSSALYKLTHFY